MAIQQQAFGYTSPVDGLQIRGFMLLPAGKPRAVVQFAHGMSEHKARYLDLMKALTSEGYACAIADHRGHGESISCDIELGYFGANGADALVTDMIQLTDELDRQFPEMPLFLFGHSMGALAAKVYIRRRDDHLRGLILCGISKQNPVAVPGLALCGVLSKVQGKRHKSKLLDNLATGAFANGLPGAKSSFAWLNSDEQEVQRYEDDPLCGFLLTVNGYYGLAQLMIQAYSKENWALRQPTLPILMISGADDPSIGGVENLKTAAAHLRERGYDNIETKAYPGMRHEIMHEPGKQQIYEDILAFLRQNTQRL